MFPKSKKLLSAILLSLLGVNAACATQIVENADKGHVQVNISVNEQNRLAVDGRRIANIVPSQKGALSVAKDQSSGSLYFTLASESNQGTVTLFVTDDKGVVYKLILTPRAIAGEEIILRPPAEKGGQASRAGKPDGRAASYERRIKDLMLVMADPELKDGTESVTVNKEIPLWKEGRLVLLSKYLDGDMVGEKYRLTNISTADMLLVEQELYRRGVRAVSIEYQTLPVGESTDIFIVRERKENE